jgi:hypothetical protein
MLMNDLALGLNNESSNEYNHYGLVQLLANYFNYRE